MRTKSQRVQKEEAQVAFDLARLNSLNSKPQEALEYFKSAVQLAPKNSKYLSRLGLELHQLEKKSDVAIRLILRSIAIDSMKYGGIIHEKIALNYLNLGSIKSSQKKYASALNYLGNALTIFTEIYGSRHIMVGRTCNKISTIYQDLGDYEEALIYSNNGLKAMRGTFAGELQPFAGDSYHNLAETHLSKGSLEIALQYGEKAFEIQKFWYGDNDSNTANVRITLGFIYYALKKFDLANGHCEKALATYQNSFGENHYSVASAYMMLAMILKKQGDYQKALKKYQKALDVSINFYGETHSSVAILYDNIGDVFVDDNQVSKSIEYFKKSLNTFQKINSLSFQKIAFINFKLGNIYNDLGDYSSALNFYRNAMSFEEKLITKYPENIAGYATNLGTVFFSLEVYDSALVYYEKSLRILNGVYSKPHPKIANNNFNIGLVHSEKKEREKAIHHFKQSLFIDQAIFGENHKRVTKRLSRIGREYFQLGYYQEARDYFFRGLKCLKSSQQMDNEEIKLMYSHIGKCFNREGLEKHHIGENKAALKNIRVSLHYSEFAKDSSLTIKCLSNMGEVQKDLGRPDSALFFLDRGIQLAEFLDQPYLTLEKHLPDSLLYDPKYQSFSGLFSHKSLLRELKFHKADCLNLVGKTKEAKMIFIKLKNDAIKRKDKVFLKKIEEKGY